MTTPFSPTTIGRLQLRNRIVMAPMTRSRAYGRGASATPLMAEYYAQRAGAGLIITEGTQPSPEGQGYPDTPGLHTAVQVEAWRGVTSAVHARGGLIFAQLMHTGRIGHPSLTGLPPVGASAIAAAGTVFTPTGPLEFVAPLARVRRGDRRRNRRAGRRRRAELAHRRLHSSESAGDGPGRLLRGDRQARDHGATGGQPPWGPRCSTNAEGPPRY